MISAAVIQGSVKMLPQGHPEVTNELGIPVRGNGLWHSMQMHNFLNNRLATRVASEVFLHAMKWDIFKYPSTTTKTEFISHWV